MSERATPAGLDPRFGAGAASRADQLLAVLPRPLRNWGVVAGVLFVLWVLAAAPNQWSNIGAQVVAGLTTGSIAALGGTGLVVATALGVAELTLGLLIGYSAYQVLREGVPPGEAAERFFGELEHGVP
jgi:hypothetical protein